LSEYAAKTSFDLSSCGAGKYISFCKGKGDGIGSALEGKLLTAFIDTFSVLKRRTGVWSFSSGV
jgi:hypothetical protein